MKQVKICPQCGFHNSLDAMDCENSAPPCGAPIDHVFASEIDDTPSASSSPTPAIAVESGTCSVPGCGMPIIPEFGECHAGHKASPATPSAQGTASPVTCCRAIRVTWPWGEKLEITASLTLGRGPDAPADLAARLVREGFDTISGRHARLYVENGQAQVCDLGSTNGTFVNEVRLAAHARHPLRAGDQLRFASGLRVHLELLS